jgi:hypothetical protein
MNAVQVDDDVKQLAREGRAAEAIALLRQRTGLDLPHARAILAPLSLMPKPASAFGVYARVVVVLLLVVALTLGLSWIGLRFADLVMAYVVQPLTRGFFPVTFSSAGLLLILVGLTFARRFRRPGRFRAGMIAMGAALLALSPHTWAFIPVRTQLPQELEFIVIVVGLALLVTVFGAGLSAVFQANNTPEGDFWDSIKGNLP